MMKAMVFDSPKKVVLKEVPIPASDGSSMIIKVAKTGVCGSDTHANWAYGNRANPSHVIFGHEFCGTVVDPGSRKDLVPGDRVVAMDINPCGECKFCKSGREDMCPQVIVDIPGVSANGGFAEYAKVKRADLVRKMPDHMTDVQGALVEPVAVAIHACNRGEMKPGDTVLVCGSGTIGMFCAAVAHARGAGKVVITGANPERRKVALEQDFIDEVVDSRAEDYHDQLKAVAPEGFDVILECSGLRKVQEGALPHLGVGGCFVIVGFQDYELTAYTVPIYMYQQRIQGCMMLTRDEFDEAIELLASRKLVLEQFVTERPLSELQECFEDLTSGHTKVLKYILTP